MHESQKWVVRSTVSRSVRYSICTASVGSLFPTTTRSQGPALACLGAQDKERARTERKKLERAHAAQSRGHAGTLAQAAAKTLI